MFNVVRICMNMHDPCISVKQRRLGELSDWDLPWFERF